MKKKVVKKSLRKVSKTKKFSVIHRIRRHILIFSSFSVVFIFLITGLFALFPQLRSGFCANSISCINDLSGEITNDTQGIFDGKKVTAPKTDYFALANKFTRVLGDQTPGSSKHIFVDLSGQRLYAYDGNQIIYNFPVSTGKWHPTPTGTFRIWIKLQATRMVGGSGADYYNLPNVPWTMYFANASIGRSEGYSLHGAYWHNNFGHPMSHGCVNIQPDNAKLLYDWAEPATTGYTTYSTDADPGTLVTIYGKTPAQ
ncbi:MAG TPA: L,D-transpeptidase [Candidatus Saccharimonadales bacterium]|nr:L,D-transpeptidase [Candidatus Saccharimonadales bacterium]